MRRNIAKHCADASSTHLLLLINQMQEMEERHQNQMTEHETRTDSKIAQLKAQCDDVERKNARLRAELERSRKAHFKNK